MSQDNISNIWEVTLNNATNYSEIGIKIEEGNNDTFGAGIFILEVRNDSPAFHGGVQIGDMLLAVNMCDFLVHAESLQQSLSGGLMVKSS